MQKAAVWLLLTNISAGPGCQRDHLEHEVVFQDPAWSDLPQT